MKLPNACASVLAFVIGTECNEYGPKFISLDPPSMERYLGTGKFGFTYRYLYSIHLALAYRVSVAPDARISVKGLRAGDIIKGSVIIFKKADAGPEGLSEFEVNAIRDSIVMLADVRGNFLRLEGVSDVSRPMAVCEDA